MKLTGMRFGTHEFSKIIEAVKKGDTYCGMDAAEIVEALLDDHRELEVRLQRATYPASDVTREVCDIPSNRILQLAQKCADNSTDAEPPSELTNDDLSECARVLRAYADDREIREGMRYLHKTAHELISEMESDELWDSYAKDGAGDEFWRDMKHRLNTLRLALDRDCDMGRVFKVALEALEKCAKCEAKTCDCAAHCTRPKTAYEAILEIHQGRKDLRWSIEQLGMVGEMVTKPRDRNALLEANGRRFDSIIAETDREYPELEKLAMDYGWSGRQVRSVLDALRREFDEANTKNDNAGRFDNHVEAWEAFKREVLDPMCEDRRESKDDAMALLRHIHLFLEWLFKAYVPKAKGK